MLTKEGSNQSVVMEPAKSILSEDYFLNFPDETNEKHEKFNKMPEKMNFPKPAVKRRHVKGLDGLRGISVIAIILYHLFPDTVKGGFLGVSFFFVISGYLLAVTSDYEWDSGKFAIGQFYKKRIKRIYPALLAVVFITLGTLKLAAPDALNGIKNEVISVLFGYNNSWQIAQNSSYFTRIGSASPFTHMWSLAIELQFYFVWPALFLMYKHWFKKDSRFEKNSRLLLLIPMALSILALEVMFQPDKDVTSVYYGTATRVFSFFMGTVMGLNFKNEPEKREISKLKKSGAGLLFAVLGSVIFASFWIIDGQSAFTYRIGLIGTSIIFCLMIKLAVNNSLKIGDMLDCRFLKWIGQHGYEIYLWQYPVIFTFKYTKLDQEITGAPVLMGIIILLLSVWLHKLVGIIMEQLKNGGKNMKLISKIAFGAMTLICAVIFVIGEYSAITAENTKKDSQAQLEAELEQNAQSLENNDASEASAPADDKNSKKAKTAAAADLNSVTFIGDSVMLGASPALKESFPGCFIDAKVSRQLIQAPDIIKNVQANGNLGNTVVLGLGTNGPFKEEQGQKVLDAIGSDKTIFWVNTYGKHLQWQKETNDIINTLAEKNDNVVVIDWASEAEQHGDWFYDDGIHLKEGNGQKGYVDFIQKQLKPENN